MENEPLKKAKKPLYSLFEIDYLISIHSDLDYYLAYKWSIDPHSGELLLYIIEIHNDFPLIQMEVRGHNSLDMIYFLNEIMIEFYSDVEEDEEDEGFEYNYSLN